MLSAAKLSTLQRCPRQYALEREYRLARIRPKLLLEKLLRQAIFELSNGGDKTLITKEATTRYLETAARPGLDTPADPYTLARDHCSIIQTVVEAVSRLVLLVVKPAPKAENWLLDSWIDELGTLHKWVVVDKWDEDTRWRELHSWDVFGDCAAVAAGMDLHVIEIGSQRRGHQHTPWCRTYKHPVIPNKMRFRKLDGTPLESSWTPVWYQNSDKNEPGIWVDLMEADRLELIHHVSIKEPSVFHVEGFHREIAALVEPGPWQSIMLSRPACDWPVVCPWQPVCYGPQDPDVEALGGFVKINV